MRLKKRGVAPKAIVNIKCEPIIAVGAIIAELPTIDGVDISIIRNGDLVEVDGATLKIYR